MPDDTPATPQYTMGYSEEFRQMLDQRSAETHACLPTPRSSPATESSTSALAPAPSP